MLKLILGIVIGYFLFSYMAPVCPVPVTVPTPSPAAKLEKDGLRSMIEKVWCGENQKCKL